MKRRMISEALLRSPMWDKPPKIQHWCEMANCKGLDVFQQSQPEYGTLWVFLHHFYCCPMHSIRQCHSNFTSHWCWRIHVWVLIKQHSTSMSIKGNIWGLQTTHRCNRRNDSPYFWKWCISQSSGCSPAPCWTQFFATSYISQGNICYQNTETWWYNIDGCEKLVNHFQRIWWLKTISRI